MAAELSIYVSASPEMDAECELLGQMLANMARSLRWKIKRTPAPHEFANPDLEALSESHFYLILLGSDITAPIGVEWRAAQEAGITTYAFRNVERVASPAAAVFAHSSAARWQAYHTPREFVQRFERALITRLLEGTPGYGLDLADVEQLIARQRVLEEADEGQPQEEERRGAGGGGVILAAGESEP
jgi:hypothetical protein